MLLRVVLALALVLPACASAQDRMSQQLQTKETYKLDYVITDLDNGKKVESHNYTMLLAVPPTFESGVPTATGRVRFSSRVPIPTGAGGYNYHDVGVNIDCRLTPVSDSIVNVSSTFSISNIVAVSNPGLPPVVNTVTAEDRGALTLGKTLTLFNVDEPASKRSYQMQLTVTRLPNP